MLQVLLFLLLVTQAFSSEIILRSRLKYSDLRARLVQNHVAFKNLQLLSPTLGIYSVEYADVVSTTELTSATLMLNTLPGTLYTSKNSFLKDRSAETDFFADPWNLGNENEFSSLALEARKQFGEPLTDKLGNEVVVAIVEGNSPSFEPSFASRMWVNQAEVPNNKKDDDQNGYVDDVTGIQTDISAHTTHVAGILASTGFGVAPNVKVVTVGYKAFNDYDTTKSAVMAYEYVMSLKRRWLTSKGKDGANIVSVNSSFGLDGANCQDANYKIWNDVYNQMGLLGIINAVATTNSVVNVDVVHDIPSACDSEFIISVGDMDENGNSKGGYGPINVDLFAQGYNIMSTVPGGFGLKSGTSMATPHVTAAIGYLYLMANQEFAQYTQAYPAQAASAVRTVILKSTTKNPRYAQQVAESGFLNLLNAAKTISVPR